MLITDETGVAPERTWRPPLEVRAARVFCMGVIVSVAAAYLALTLWTNQVQHAIWIALAAGLTSWGLLAWRVLAQRVTLTADTLVIRNMFTTERVPLADVTGVCFRRSKLTVTSEHGALASERRGIAIAPLGSSYWSGRRTRADAIADAIADAAGLAPLPPRREIISRNRAWMLLVAAAVFFGLGVYLGPVGSMELHHRSLAVAEVGGMCYVFGITALGFAFRLIRDHRRKRPRQPRT